MAKDEFLKVEGETSWTKNPVRGAIKNIDVKGYHARRQKIKAEKQVQERIALLEGEMQEIKDMLRELLKRK